VASGADAPFDALLRHEQSSAGSEQQAPVAAFGVGSPQQALGLTAAGAAAFGAAVDAAVPQQDPDLAAVLFEVSGELDMVVDGLRREEPSILTGVDILRQRKTRAGAGRRDQPSDWR
jgi:hypothetical protein